MKVKFTGKNEDHYGRLRYDFEAEGVHGFEYSLIAFGLNEHGKLVMLTKYFRELPRSTQDSLVALARAQM